MSEGKSGVSPCNPCSHQEVISQASVHEGHEMSNMHGSDIANDGNHTHKVSLHPQSQAYTPKGSKVSPDNSDSVIFVEQEEIVEHQPPTEDANSLSFSNVVRVLGATMVMGLVFGISMQKSNVYAPWTIRNQYLFEAFTMLKLFLAAAGTGAIVLQMLAWLPITKRSFEWSEKAFLSCVNARGWPSVAAGAFTLGAGMALSGGCPGMVLVQIGSGVQWSGLIFLGGLAGGLTYALLQERLAPFVAWKKLPYTTVTEWMGVPRGVLALGLAACCFGTVIGLEAAFPWKTEFPPSAPYPKHPKEAFEALYWPPWLSGMFIGLMQAPAVVFLFDTLGSSSSFMTVLSMVLVTDGLRKRFSHLAGFRSGLGNWWQVTYVTFAILGGLISAQLSRSSGLQTGPNPYEAVLGGFMLIFGSRVAGGCTSGHGLSGMAMLTSTSFVAVPAMFAGGAAMAYFLKATDLLLYA